MITRNIIIINILVSINIIIIIIVSINIIIIIVSIKIIIIIERVCPRGLLLLLPSRAKHRNLR